MPEGKRNIKGEDRMKTLLKDKFAWILFAGSLMMCWLFVGQYGIFGSRVDWICQHSVFPDYFRQRFYETGSIFPDMAWNLGGGQNIYNFSYYGLLNPVILFSYLLPFVRMDIYVMVSSALCYSTSVVLFYKWLEGRGFSDSVRNGVSCMFALAAPLIYHSYNQLMFVNYMPFLCLALMGADRYFRLKKRGMLIGGICGMIFSSFYFSIGGLMALCIYVIGEYLWTHREYSREKKIEENQKEDRKKYLKEDIKRFIKMGSAFAGNILLSVCLSGVLLVPTAFSIASGRTGDVQTDLAIRFLSFKPERFVYSAYGIGLTSFVLVALMGRVIGSGSWRERWNGICLLVIFNVPFFGYMLNGGLYDKDKVFIPFLPIICLEIARYCSESLCPYAGKKIRMVEKEDLLGGAA